MTAEPAVSGTAVDAIQPGGFALVVDRDWCVRRVSQNLDQFFPGDPTSRLGSPLADMMSADAVHSLRNRMTLMRGPTAYTRLFACRALGDGTRFDFVVRALAPNILIEGRSSGRAEHGDTAEMVRALIFQLDGDHDGSALLAQAALQLRAMTGYDRVACYGFKEGDVASLAAQSTRKMGPAPERLPPWFACTTRIVVDGDKQSVPLLPLASEGTGREALFGAAIPATQRWLDERGATAAMALSLRVGPASWGAIVCDHPTARRVSFDRQAAFELYADMLAMKLEIAQLRHV